MNKDQHSSYPPLNEIKRSHLKTDEAAYYLCRKPQTLRCWVCHQDGPIRPVKIGNKLLWAVKDIKKLLNGK